MGGNSIAKGAVLRRIALCSDGIVVSYILHMRAAVKPGVPRAKDQSSLVKDIVT